MVLDDPALIGETIRDFEATGRNIETCFQKVAARYIKAFSEFEDKFLAERAIDLRDVAQRMVKNLLGQAETSLSHLAGQRIIVASDISPSESATLDRSAALALALNSGSKTSHAAIVARSMRIPSVVSLHNLTARVHNGDWAIVDGYDGLVIVNPTESTLFRYGKIQERKKSFEARLLESNREPAVTLDGVPVTLLANIEKAEECAAAKSFRAEGVGLYRTEFLFVDRADLPSENEQYEAYASIVHAFGGATVTLRTFDIGGDKFASSFELPPEMNPALGLRAIRLALAQPEVFSTQLRAMVRAARHGNVRIMLPMISTTDEIAAARALLARAEADVARSFGKRVDPIPLGAMIEVPAAAVMADVLARHADFFSIGTNDLVQYALAVDRTSRTLAHLASPLSPAILRLCAMAIRAANAAKIPVSVCGTMASEPLHALLLVGLGVRELSMEASAIPVVREAISRASMAELARIAELCLEAETEARVREAVSSSLGPRLLDLDAVRDGA